MHPYKKFVNLLFKKKKIVIFIFVILIPFIIFFSQKNLFKFESKFKHYKFKILEEYINEKNKLTLEDLKNNFIYLDKKKYNFKRIDLSLKSIKFINNYINRPLGYIDIYKKRIVFVTGDGRLFISNRINISKLNLLYFDEFKAVNFVSNFDMEDKNYYRNFVIRDILIEKNYIYIVHTGRNKDLNNNYYASPKILKGKIDLINKKVFFENFFSFQEKIYNVGDWSHTGGRLVKYKDNSFLFSVPDHNIPNEDLKKNLKSYNQITGKILLIKKEKYEIFSKGHRNPQGLFYDKEYDLILETEHGPTGGDEVNLIKRKEDYGWPLSTYGAHIPNINKYRNHSNHNFMEPLYYWWPFSSAASQIIKIPNKFNKLWQDSYLMSTLSGSGNQGKSLYRFKFSKNKKKFIKLNKFFLGDRIRDLKYYNEENILIILLEDSKSLAFIYN
jgi:hypothetical protein